LERVGHGEASISLAYIEAKDYATKRCAVRRYNGSMPFVIEDTWLPAQLTAGPMTDEAFAELVDAHPDLRFEMTASGDLIVMPPNNTKTGARNADITTDLGMWARGNGRGRVFDSSTGYVLPNGARRSPDASWVARHRILNMNENNRENYFHLCPDFVIELRSQSERLPVLRDRMREYIENGAQLGWLLDPERRAVEIYRPDTEPEIREEVMSIAAKGPVAGFVLDLGRVWNPWG
jgi:Uma2 family endonuclease